LQGKTVVFVTGSDEHGEKIATTAAGKDKDPKEFCDGIVSEFKALWQKMDIKYDSFVRTYIYIYIYIHTYEPNFK
jgi:methionyl-tRNA synthetase